MWRRMENVKRVDGVRNEKALKRTKEGRTIIETLKKKRITGLDIQLEEKEILTANRT